MWYKYLLILVMPFLLSSCEFSISNAEKEYVLNKFEITNIETFYCHVDTSMKEDECLKIRPYFVWKRGYVNLIAVKIDRVFYTDSSTSSPSSAPPMGEDGTNQRFNSMKIYVGNEDVTDDLIGYKESAKGANIGFSESGDGFTVSDLGCEIFPYYSNVRELMDDLGSENSQLNNDNTLYSFFVVTNGILDKTEGLVERDVSVKYDFK